MKHIQRCNQQEITSNKTSNESHKRWKKHFLLNPLYFRIYADFEVDKEVDHSCKGDKTTKNFKQNPVCNGYYVVSELNDVSQSRYFELAPEYHIVDCFAEEVIKLQNKKIFF